MDQRQRAASAVRTIGMGIMIVFSLTQLVPTLELAGMAVWTGLISFFAVEALSGTSGKKSSLRFDTMGRELQDRSIWLLIGLLTCTQILNVAAGHLIFGQAYVDYDMGRAFDVMHSESIIRLFCPGPILGMGRGDCVARIFPRKETGKDSFLAMGSHVVHPVCNGACVTA